LFSLVESQSRAVSEFVLPQGSPGVDARVLWISGAGVARANAYRLPVLTQSVEPAVAPGAQIDSGPAARA